MIICRPFPIWIDGVRVRAHGVDPPPGCGALVASLFRCPLQIHIPLGEREGARKGARERESRTLVKSTERKSGEKHGKQRHKWHPWQRFCSRPSFLFVGSLRLFRRRGYTPQMKVRLFGENKCGGLQTSSPLRVCMSSRCGASLRGPSSRVRGAATSLVVGTPSHCDFLRGLM